MVNSYTSTVPPARMHTVKVGVGVKGMGVLVLVIAGVMGGEVGWFVDTGNGTLTVSMLRGAAVDSNRVDVGVTWIESCGTNPQAGKRINRMLKPINLLSTFAVYHNKPPAMEILSPSEYLAVITRFILSLVKLLDTIIHGEMNA